MSTNLSARLATEIGTRISLRRYWGNTCQQGSYKSYHNAMVKVKDVHECIESFTGKACADSPPEEYPVEMWPTKCDHCGQPCPEGTIYQVFNERLYDTPSGELEPGCLYWNTWLPENFYWDNHKGPHLMAVCPDGNHWNIDSRASNCTKKEDRVHRCWVRHGEPPNVHVDKNGLTCSAGAGSIQVATWHGFLHHGEFHG